MDTQNGLNLRLINVTTALIATTLVVYICIVGRSILLPIVAAIVLWYLIIRLTATFSRVPFTKIRIPFVIALILAFVATGIIVYALVNLISHSINGIVQDAPKYQERLNELLQWVNSTLHIKLDFRKMLEKVNLTSIFTNIALSVTFITGNLALIFVYVMFLLLESKTLDKKLSVIFGGADKAARVSHLLQRISKDINTYMKVKTWMSLLTGVLSYLILTSFGVDYAQFWAVLIFLLNFIPTVGSILAVIFTLLAVSVQITTWSSFIFLALLLVGVQFVVGNILEPRFMGKNLNLSPLVILIALAFWGSVWGVLGMFLCVPLMTILNIILANFDNTRHLAVLLSANPEALV